MKYVSVKYALYMVLLAFSGGALVLLDQLLFKTKILFLIGFAISVIGVLLGGLIVASLIIYRIYNIFNKLMS